MVAHSHDRAFDVRYLMGRTAIQQQALRVASVIVLGLSIEMLRGAIIPGLAAIIAITILGGGGKALGVKQGIGVIGVVSGAALFVLAVTSFAVEFASLYTLCITVMYIWAFYLAVTPKTAPFGQMFLTMLVSVSALTAASPDLAAFIVQEMILSVSIGVGLTLVVFMIWPQVTARPGLVPEPNDQPRGTLTHALIATLIILPLHMYLTFDGLAAIVILLTTAMMLSQPNLSRSKAYGVTFALGNVVGGLLALVAAFLIATQPSPLVFLFVGLAGALFLAVAMGTSDRAAIVFKPAAIAFALLFGMTLSPLATSDDVGVWIRVAQIMFAIGYVLCITSLIMPVLNARLTKTPAASVSN